MTYINSMGTNETYTGTYRNKTEQRCSGTFEIPEHKQLQQYVPLLVTVTAVLRAGEIQRCKALIIQ